jgi:hypothetical protein
MRTISRVWSPKIKEKRSKWQSLFLDLNGVIWVQKVFIQAKEITEYNKTEYTGWITKNNH